MPFLGATELGEGRQAGSPPILVRVRGGVVVVAGRPNNISVSRLGARKACGDGGQSECRTASN